jgi:hypothetical protein
LIHRFPILWNGILELSIKLLPDFESLWEHFSAKMREFIIDLVKKLPEPAFEIEKVVNQFSIELVGHYHDHNIPEME